MILDPVPFNAETWMCARVSELAAQQGIRGLVAFADPVARYRPTAGGGIELIKPGHLGVVYMAGGWQYTGRGTARHLVVLPDASRFECIHRSGRTIRWHAITDDRTPFSCRLGVKWAERYPWEIVPAQSAYSPTSS